MSTVLYKIISKNNELQIIKPESKTEIYSSFWYLDFGKTCAEIKNDKGEKIYSIIKKFQFWKWKMVYFISRNIENQSFLISQNSRNTIFKMELVSGNYEIKVHYQKKKSIFKNGIKIAEFDESFLEKNDIEVIVIDEKEIKIIFLLYVCLLMGINNFKSKTILKSQKQLEKNLDPWF